VQTTPPLIFRLARKMERRGWRGSSFLIRVAGKAGVLDEPVLFPLGNSIQIEVPVRRVNFDADDIAEYERDFVQQMALAVRAMSEPVTLIDVGADIGLFSLKLIAACSSIRRVIGFEPNPEGFASMKNSFSRLPFEAHAIQKGVADHEGRAKLVCPDYGLDYAANFIESTGDGPIAITTLDALETGGVNLCLKIDVEGGELAVIRGAEKLIRSAPNVVVGLEANPSVVQRTGIDLAECLRLLETWRPFRFFVSETKANIDSSRQVAEQVPGEGVFNLIATSLPDVPALQKIQQSDRRESEL
jgi:FkbM family methyltransferase